MSKDSFETSYPIAGVVIAPVHLKSLSDICDTFSKSRETVKGWYGDGAPIAFDGERYSAEYNALQAWLVQRYGFQSTLLKSDKITLR